MHVLDVMRHTLLGAACLVLAGCAIPVVESTPATSAAGQTGLLYALPKAQVQLVAQRKRVDAAEIAAAQKEAAEQKAAVAAAKTLVTAAKAALKDADETLAAALADAASSAETRAKLQQQAGIAKAVLTVMDARHKAAEARASAAALAATGDAVELGLCRETASLTVLPHAPDPKARFLASHASSAWRDDQLTLSVTPTGLLNTATTVSTDQTGSTILSLVQAFAGLRAGGPGLNIMKGRSTDEPSTKPEACEEYKTSRVLDPTQKQELKETARQLQQVGSQVGLCVDGLGSGTAATMKDKVTGFAYRASRPIRLTVTGRPQNNPAQCEHAPNTEAASLVAHLPDASTLFVTPVTAAAFTKVSNKHTFKDGMLVEVSLDKPSVVAAVASLPVEILKALVSIPASIIKLRVDYESQSEALATTQANVLKAQVDLLNAQKALEDRLALDSPGP